MYNLGKHFEVSLGLSKGNEESIVRGRTYRFTVLTERLIRMEYSPNGVFYDLPSQFALFRNLEKPRYEIKQDEKYLTIATEYFQLDYQKEKSFDAGNVVPTLNLKVSVRTTDKTWHYNHSEAKNYLGVVTSLDGDKHNRDVNRGLYSLDGFVSFDDSKTMLINQDGTLSSREEKVIDIYLFAYGKDFDKALYDYYKLTGQPPLIPRYALGNWWSRNYEYKDDEIMSLINEFRRNDIPLSTMVLDKDWHERIDSNNIKHKTGFTFNKELIEEPTSLINQIHNANVRIGIQTDPREGYRKEEELYKQVLAYVDPKENGVVDFDPLNNKVLDIYMKFFLHSLEAKGVDFFWNDYEVVNKEKDILTLWMLNHYHFLDIDRDDDKRGMLLARNAVIASHRYPITYSGKLQATWQSLKYVSLLNQQAANIGVSWLSHDVGGNHGGIEDPELYIRNIQLATFSPIVRFHQSRGKYYKRLPWMWDIKTFNIAREYLKLRHRLIPYIYTEAYNYHKNGVPIVRPLYYEYPWVYDDEFYKGQYYFGSLMMVAPILNKKDHVMNRTIHRFFVPNGIWYDYKTGKKFPGNKKYVSFFKDEDFPVFVKSGSIVTHSNKSNMNNISNPSEMEIELFPGASSKYMLYEDDGITSLYKDGYYLKTELNYIYQPNNYIFTIRSLEGKTGIVPDHRDYKVRFKNTRKGGSVRTLFNNSMIENTETEDGNDLIISINQVPSIGTLYVSYGGEDLEIEAVSLINDDIDSILFDLQIDTYLKEKISGIIFNKDLILNKKKIAIKKLKSSGLSRDHIKLFIKLLDYIGGV